MGHRLLLVEDDAVTTGHVAQALEEEGFAVEVAPDGGEGLSLASSGAFDAIILDRMLPGMDGMSVLAALREQGVETPVLILSALGSVDERVRGLDAGSDDYLAKPFALAELLARVRLLLRRRGAAAPVETVLRCADLEMDLLARTVSRDGTPIDLQPREFRLLEYLLRHAGEVVTRTMLLEGVWNYHFDPGTNVIDVHVSRLRKKLDEGRDQPLLHTVRGVGYRFGPDG